MSTHATLLVIRDEHSALSAVLRSISPLLSEHRRRHTLPDFTVLRAMLFYIDEFPEQIHHTKESELLFPKVRARSAEGAEVLDRLDADHERSAIRVRELVGFEMMVDGPDGAALRAAFEEAMDKYIFEYLDHIRTEERVVLPLAERVLTTADWLELDAAFMQNRDPLTRREGDDAYRPLFKRILMTAAAPIGLGPAMEAMQQSYPQPGARSPDR
jgi:hemerythrin-like domain-containing protein